MMVEKGGLIMIDREDDGYYLYKLIEKQKKKILRDEIEDRENEENEKFAQEQKEAYKIRLRPKLF